MTNSVIVDWPVGDSEPLDRHHFEIPRDNRTNFDWMFGTDGVWETIEAHWGTNQPTDTVGLYVEISWEGTDPFRVYRDLNGPAGPTSEDWRDATIQTAIDRWYEYPPV